MKLFTSIKTLFTVAFLVTLSGSLQVTLGCGEPIKKTRYPAASAPCASVGTSIYPAVSPIIPATRLSPEEQVKLNKKLLDAATRSSDISIVLETLGCGADINTQNDARETPLHLAINSGNRNLVEALLDHKPKLNGLNNHRETPLALAAFVESEPIAEMLVRAGANVNVQHRNYGGTPLHSAAQAGLESLAKILIRLNAKVDAKDNRESTPLHEAAESYEPVGKCLGLVKILLSANARLDIKNKRGMTPLDVAEEFGHHEVAKIIKEEIEKRAAATKTKNVPSTTDISTKIDTNQPVAAATNTKNPSDKSVTAAFISGGSNATGQIQSVSTLAAVSQADHTAKGGTTLPGILFDTAGSK